MIQTLQSPETQLDVLRELRERAQRGTTVREIVELLRCRLGHKENMIIPTLWYVTQAFGLPLPEALPMREWIDADEDAAVTEGGRVWPIAGQALKSRPHLKPPHRLNYSGILDRILDEMTEIECCDEEGQVVAVSKFWRPCFRFRVSEETFDLFFNSAKGYRARYYDDHTRGPDADRETIDKVFDRLMAVWRTTATQVKEVERVKTSLLDKRSAKVWFNDGTYPGKDAAIQPITEPRSLTPDTAEMLIPTWLREAANNDARAQLGLNAFRGEFLVIKGTWLDSRNEERTTPVKLDRAKNLARFGFI